MVMEQACIWVVVVVTGSCTWVEGHGTTDTGTYTQV